MLAAGVCASFEFSLAQCGCLVRPLFDQRRQGRVAAVFANSFYVEAENQYACVVGPGAGASPLNLVVRTSSAVDWPACGLATAMPIEFRDDCLIVANKFRFLGADAEVWTPSRPAQDWDLQTFRAGLAGFRETALRCAPAEGLGRLVFGDRAAALSPVCSPEVLAVVDSISDGLAAALNDPGATVTAEFESARMLLGMGPGLTPSGDDFVGGLMIALHGANLGVISDRLWRCLLPAVGERTNAISRAHLESASRGLGCAAVHHLLNAILEGRVEDIAELTRGIDQIGHTSGWDIMAGVACAGDAVWRMDAL